MGYALVVAVVRDAELTQRALYVWRDGKEVRLRDLYTEEECWRLCREPGGLPALHPDAYFRVRVPFADVWSPPREPEGIREDRKLQRARTRVLRDLLQAFLNERLATLDGMLRTGWWVMGKARVRVVELRHVP